MTNTTAAAKTAAAAAAPILNNCLCSQFEIVTREFELPGGEPDYDAESTGCTETTAREFAPGHDAKLKSLLIRAGIAGLEVRQNLGGVVHSGTAETMGRQFAFGYMVQTGIERGRAKAAAKAEKKAARKAAPKAKTNKPAVEMPRKVGAHVVAAITAAAVEASTEGPAVLRELLTLDGPAAETVKIKVGRWEYSAVIADNGDATYTTAKGGSAVAVKGTYKLA